MRYITSAIFLDIWNKKNLIGRFCVPYVYAYCIFLVLPWVLSSCGHFDTIAAALQQIERFLEPRTFWYIMHQKSGIIIIIIIPKSKYFGAFGKNLKRNFFE